MRHPPAIALGLFLPLVVPAAALADGSVVLFPALGRPNAVVVTGRVLKTTPEHHSSGLSKNLRRLISRSHKGAEVAVSFAGQTMTVVSGDEGLFEASFVAPAGAPFPLGLQPVRAEAAGVSADGKVDVIADRAPFLVISDFDDTVAVTNVQSKRVLIKTALLVDEDSQPAVEGMAAFYACLRAGKASPPGFAVVSGSPIEFGPRLQAFLDKGGFPFAALHLRDLRPSTLKGYKEPVLRTLLARFPHKVVLVGDSGEADPEVYATIRKGFPGRVLAVFIRDVGKSSDPARFKDMVLFKTAADAAKEAAARGLVDSGCAVAPGAGSKPE